MMNKGGRGKETREKFCYACSKPKSKLEFSSSQWDVKEDLKSRRCSACIDGRCQVGALLPGQLKLTFGTPANTAANSTPPQPPPALLPSPPISSSVSTVVAPNPSSASTVVAPNPSSVSTVVAAAPTRTFADIVEKRIADAAAYNTTFRVGVPIANAAIRATFAHARTHAMGELPAPSGKHMTIEFGLPAMSAETTEADYMAAGSKLRIIDHRNFGFEPSWFKCPKCQVHTCDQTILPSLPVPPCSPRSRSCTRCGRVS